MPQRLYLTGLLYLCLLLPACGQTTNRAYALLLKGMYGNAVPTLTPTELEATLQQKTHLVLLDTRSEKEYGVSHLAGARLVVYETFDPGQLAGIPKATPIVVYCSVGYRSDRVGEVLQAAGYTQVHNLYGGLFEWVNQGRPVYNRQGKTEKVHAYSRAWGVWLRKGEKVYD
jgi:rhodanese-related sulfurtransferase